MMFAYSDRERTGRPESPLIETGKSGYYECLIKEEKDCGFYEIWDNRNDPNGIFSDMFLAYRLGEFDASLAPYITDLNGEVFSTDITPFPILYCLESICISDPICNFR